MGVTNGPVDRRFTRPDSPAAAAGLPGRRVLGCNRMVTAAQMYWTRRSEQGALGTKVRNQCGVTRYLSAVNRDAARPLNRV